MTDRNKIDIEYCFNLNGRERRLQNGMQRYGSDGHHDPFRYEIPQDEFKKRHERGGSKPVFMLLNLEDVYRAIDDISTKKSSWKVRKKLVRGFEIAYNYVFFNRNNIEDVFIEWHKLKPFIHTIESRLRTRVQVLWAGAASIVASIASIFTVLEYFKTT